MTLKVHLPNEFSPHTTPSSEDSPIKYASAETLKPRGEVYYLDCSQPTAKLPTGSIEIDDLVAKYEQLPDRKKALEKARKWVADEFHSSDPNALRVFRLKKGLSQARLGEIIGTTQAHIARIESGKWDVQLGTLSRLARALDADPIEVVRAFLKQEANTANDG